MTKIQVNSQGKAYLTTAGKALAGVQPTLVTKSITENGTYNASSDNADGYSSVTVNVSGGGGSAKYGCTVDNLLGNVDANGVLQLPTAPSGGIVFSGVKDIVDYGLIYKFYFNTNLTGSVSFPDLENLTGFSAVQYAFEKTNITSVSFQKLVSITNNSAFLRTFCETNLTSISFPELTTVSANSVFSNLCRDCNQLVTAHFPKLSTLTGSGVFVSSFYGNTALTDIYFNALTTTSFGSNVTQFNNMMQNTGTNVTHTVHFPSNLTSTISGLSGYPTFGGTSGYVTLAFDLPATT